MSTATRTMRNVGLIALDEIQAGADSKPRSWVMLLPEGKFQHHTYGQIDLTRTALGELMQHFHDEVRGIELALDYDHRASEGDSKAPGWIEDVEYRPASGETPAGLWGKIRWTSVGLSDVKDELYKYISAEFKPSYTDERTGKKFKNVLIGATLTNRPFMKQMPAIALSARKFQKPGQYTKADRAKIDAGDFAGPHRSFPILTQQDVHDAARLIGHAADPAAVKARIKAIARRKGFSLPAEWEDDDTTAASESAAKAGSRGMKTRDQVTLDDQFDPEDETDDAEAEDFEETESDAEAESDDDEQDEESEEDDDAELTQLADRAPSGKGGKKSAAADDEDAEDEADNGDDEADEGEALDDGTDDSEDYAEEDEEEVPAPKAKAMKKGAAMSSRKMTESEAQAEIVRLSEENRAKDIKLREYETKERVGKLGRALKLAEDALEDGDEDARTARFASSRVLRKKYAEFLGNTKLSEQMLDKLGDLIETAVKFGAVDQSAMANKVDLDDRREQPRRKGAVPGDAETERAKAIALSEYKTQLHLLKDEDMQQVYDRAYAETNGNGHRR